MNQPVNRRRFERFALPAMYTTIGARLLGEDTFTRFGHIYDVSEGGVRFELDRPIEPGTPVALQIILPGPDAGPGRGVFVFANVIWIDDDADEPGPARMAAAFTRFARAGDRERLLAQLASGRYARAA